MAQQIGARRADTPKVFRVLLPLALLGTALAPGTALAGDLPQWCQSAREQVLEWSNTQAKDRGRPYVTAIKSTRTVLDRVIESPSDGVVLRCIGKGILSNGITSRVSYGFRSIDGTWYLFLKRAR